MRIYLAGPFMDCTGHEIHYWRDWVKAKMRKSGHRCFDPSRKKIRLGLTDVKQIKKLVIDKDINAISKCDWLFAYCWKPTYGTAMEILAAKCLGVKVATVALENSTPSYWLMAYSDFVVHNLQEACDRIIESEDKK